MSSRAEPFREVDSQPHERGTMPNEVPPNQRDRLVAEGPARRQDGHDDGQPVPSEIPVGPEGPSIGVPERRCWRCLQMFPGDAPAGPSPTADFWLCDPCDATLIPQRAGRAITG